MNLRQTFLTASTMLMTVALVAAVWLANSLTKWCGPFHIVLGKQVSALSTELQVSLGGGLACLAVSHYSLRVLQDRLCGLIFAAIPFAAAFAFLVAGWLLMYSRDTGAFGGIVVKCLYDSRTFAQLLADTMSNLWRNNRSLVVGDVAVVAVLVGQLAWAALSTKSSDAKPTRPQ